MAIAASAQLPSLSTHERDEAARELQAVLVDLVDLSLLGKQLHWTVVGPHFRSLHLQLDELVDAWRDAADEVAERAVALGHAPDGRIATMAAQTPLPALDAGPQQDTELIGALTNLLTEAIGTIRTRMDRLEDVDTVTADLLHGVVAKLEEQAWMIRVQAA